MKVQHTIRTTYRLADGVPIYHVTVWATCRTRAAAQAVIQRATGTTKGRK